MSYTQKILFDIETKDKINWKIIRNKDGFLISHEQFDNFGLFNDSSNVLNVSLQTIKWISNSFEEKYTGFIQNYIKNESNCWNLGDFISDELLCTGNRLVLTQTRYFRSKPKDECLSEISSLHHINISNVVVSLLPGNGFHRKFHITKNTQGEVGLLFIFTRDSFIDSFDSNILALKGYGSYKIYGDVDLEAAAYDNNARLHLLVLNIKRDFIGEIDLPFHLR